MTQALQSILFMGGVTLCFAALTLAPRWAQRVFTFGGMGVGAILVAHGVTHLDASVLLGGLMLLGLFYGLDEVLLALRRPVLLPGDTPGGADAPGASGKRDGERHAPILPGVAPTAGRAGRPRSFSEWSR